MRIGVVGGGVVGRAIARSYLEFAAVRVHDIVPELATHSLMDVVDSDVVFVCLPTPATADGTGMDLSMVENFFARWKGSKVNWVLKSTVPVGTTRWLCEQFDLPNLLHSPEFLTARCAVTDAQIPARNIVGSPMDLLQLWDDSVCNVRAGLTHLYERRFPGTPVHVMTADCSEAVKLLTNAMFAVKVAFFNEAREFCDSLNLQWETVRNGVLSDGRVGYSHTTVPGPDGKRGFGGPCLPKDLAALVGQMDSLGLSPMVTTAALTRNKSDRERCPQ